MECCVHGVKRQATECKNIFIKYTFNVGFILKTQKGILKFFVSLFIYFERQRDRACKCGKDTEGERESQAGSMLSGQSPMWGSNLEIIT